MDPVLWDHDIWALISWYNAYWYNIYMYICIYVYMYFNIHSVICIYTCIFIHIYIRNLYIHTHINDKHRCLKCLDGTTHSIGFPITIWPFPTGFTSEAPRFWDTSMILGDPTGATGTTNNCRFLGGFLELYACSGSHRHAPLLCPSESQE